MQSKKMYGVKIINLQVFRKLLFTAEMQFFSGDPFS